VNYLPRRKHCALFTRTNYLCLCWESHQNRWFHSSGKVQAFLCGAYRQRFVQPVNLGL